MSSIGNRLEALGRSRLLPGYGVRYWALVKGHKAALAWLLLGGLVVASTIGLATPLLILKIIDEGVSKNDVEALGFYALLCLLVMLVQGLARYFMRLKRARLRNSVVQEVSLKVLGDFYRLPYKSVLRKDRGYYISRINDEVPRAVEPLLEVVVSLSVTGLSLLASLAVVLALSWRVALVVCIGVPLFHALSRQLSKRIRQSWQQATEREALAKGILDRLVGAHRVVNLFAMQQKAEEQYTRALQRQMQKTFANARYRAIFWSVGAGFLNGSVLLVLAFSGYEVIQGRLTLGGMMALTNIYGRMIGYAQEMVNLMPNLHNARVTLDRLYEFQAQAEERLPRLASAEGVAVRGMGFAYDSEEVCRNLSLTIGKGERVLVLGSNGTGKTTLAHVLAGMLRPTSGTAQVPSLDRISAAFFPPVFVPGDIADNVGFDRLSADRKELFYRLAETFEIQDVIDQDPHGLSAGQRQKASILRALLKDADLYIFDEPFSNVDARTKGKLFRAVLDVTRGKGLLMVMHGEEGLHSEFDQVIDLDEVASHLFGGRQAGKGDDHHSETLQMGGKR